MNRPLAMLGAYTNILRCESAIAAGDETWRAIAALMLPCYRNALKVLAQGLSAEEQRTFERLVVDVHVDGESMRVAANDPS